MIRLDRYLSSSGLVSRSQAKKAIRSGRVAVDQIIRKEPDFVFDPCRSEVRYDENILVYRSSLHIMLFKPTGVVTAATDNRSRTILELLPDFVRSANCMPVGRLDKETDGLLLLTTDGQLGHRLISPKRHIVKEYLACVDQPLDEKDVIAFAEGLQLSDFQALPAELEIFGDSRHAKVSVCEGKYHQVRRMFSARGKKVLSLRRVSFGSLVLDPLLTPGSYRELTQEEISSLYALAGMPLPGINNSRG